MIFCMGKEIVKYETMTEMFNELTKDGDIVTSIEDGIIKLNQAGTEIEIQFFKADISNTKTELESAVVEFRNELRENIKSLKNSGINVSPEETKKLSNKFEFIKNIK